MAIEEFDVFIIGTGTAGKKVAYACAKAGWSVAIADNREYGGTCANRGCDPKKVLVGITEVLERSRDLKGKGIIDTPEANWQDLMEFKKTFTDAVPFATERDLEEAGEQLKSAQAPQGMVRVSVPVDLPLDVLAEAYFSKILSNV